MQIFLITLGVILTAVALLSIGVIIKGKPFKGSCGGANQFATMHGVDFDFECDFCGATDPDECAGEPADIKT